MKTQITLATSKNRHARWDISPQRLTLQKRS